MTQPLRVAAIDCGTNSLRLLVAERAQHGATDVVRRSEIVRLGEDVDATRRIAPEALRRTLAVLAGYAAEIRACGVQRARMVATSATRDARNRAEFVAGVREVLGVEPEVITGDEEARLSFAGATRGLDPEAHPPPYLVVDVGGGSTEFVLGGPGRPLASVSVDVGSVRLTERHVHHDPMSAAEVAAVVAEVDAVLDGVGAVVPLGAAGTLVGVAGTVTTLAAVALGLPEYVAERVHLSRVPADTVGAVAARLAAMTAAERGALGVVPPGRVDVIVAGALLLRRVVERTGVADLVVSEHDILDGIAAALLAGDT